MGQVHIDLDKFWSILKIRFKRPRQYKLQFVTTISFKCIIKRVVTAGDLLLWTLSTTYSHKSLLLRNSSLTWRCLFHWGNISCSSHLNPTAVLLFKTKVIANICHRCKWRKVYVVMNFKKICCFVPLKLKTNIMYSLALFNWYVVSMMYFSRIIELYNILLNGVSR